MIVSVVSIYDTYLVGLFVRLTFPPLFSSLGTIVVSRTFGTQDGNYRDTSIVYWFLYSSDMCSCRACSTNP